MLCSRETLRRVFIDLFVLGSVESGTISVNLFILNGSSKSAVPLERIAEDYCICQQVENWGKAT